MHTQHRKSLSGMVGFQPRTSFSYCAAQVQVQQIKLTLYCLTKASQPQTIAFRVEKLFK